MENKTAKMSLRLTRAQCEYVEKQSKKYGINSSEYVRRLVEQDMGRMEIREMDTKETYLQKKELIYEINRIGNNINQIAKNVNSSYYTDYEKKKLFAMMEKVNMLLYARL